MRGAMNHEASDTTRATLVRFSAALEAEVQSMTRAGIDRTTALQTLLHKLMRREASSPQLRPLDPPSDGTSRAMHQAGLMLGSHQAERVMLLQTEIRTMRQRGLSHNACVEEMIERLTRLSGAKRYARDLLLSHTKRGRNTPQIDHLDSINDPAARARLSAPSPASRTHPWPPSIVSAATQPLPHTPLHPHAQARNKRKSPPRDNRIHYLESTNPAIATIHTTAAALSSSPQPTATITTTTTTTTTTPLLMTPPSSSTISSPITASHYGEHHQQHNPINLHARFSEVTNTSVISLSHEPAAPEAKRTCIGNHRHELGFESD
eukprot:TRINITY_DN3502_c0_g1_i1.p1 TRINITY_DN3502_c0_g1~~TRINITY_DN3502_c0_g1_i1.p1  ORF type:complete len:321 (+),score=57.71 TRINITY_DN3502_c0_g1_i1:59-1021(+)